MWSVWPAWRCSFFSRMNKVLAGSQKVEKKKEKKIHPQTVLAPIMFGEVFTRCAFYVTGSVCSCKTASCQIKIYHQKCSVMTA